MKHSHLFSPKKLIIPAIAVLALIIVVSFCTTQVPTGYTGIVTTFGRVEDTTLEAGFHFKSPFQKIILMDNREQKTSFKTEAFSSDIQQVDIFIAEIEVQWCYLCRDGHTDIVRIDLRQFIDQCRILHLTSAS